MGSTVIFQACIPCIPRMSPIIWKDREGREEGFPHIMILQLVEIEDKATSGDQELERGQWKEDKVPFLENTSVVSSEIIFVPVHFVLEHVDTRILVSDHSIPDFLG